MQAFAESSSSTSGGGLIGVEPMPLRLTFDAAAIADLRSKNIYLERSIPISVPAPAQEATAEREREQRERDREKS
jgi:hypothetical protein